MGNNNVPHLLRLESGSIINIDHIIYVDKSLKAYLLGLTQPVELTQEDYELITRSAEYSETLIWFGMNELATMSAEKSLKLMTELIMHFVAHSIAHQQGSLNTFPLQAVFERIANIMNEINTSSVIEDIDDSEQDEEVETYEEEDTNV